MAKVHMGYIGSAQLSSPSNKIATTPVFLTGSSINPVQNINAPDLVQGQYVKHLWNQDKIEIGGNITGPIASNHTSVFDAAFLRDTSGTQVNVDHMNAEDLVVEISYYRSAGRKFNHCAINSYELTVTAGDVANFTVDFMGTADPIDPASKGVEGQSDKNFPADCLKLVTWDRCGFNLTPAPADFEVQAFTFTVNNNLQRVYKIWTTNDTPAYKLYPVELVAGFQDMNGTLTVFAEGGAPEAVYTVSTAGAAGFGAESYDTYSVTNKHTVNLMVGKGAGVTTIIDETLDVVFRRPEASARTDVQVYTLNYQVLCSKSLT